MVFAITLFHYFTTSPAFAAFKDYGWGARPSAMGGAYTAISNDAEGTLYNPAGLGRLESRQLSLMYAKPYAGLDLNAGSDGTTSLGMNYLAAVSPLGRFGSLGLTWANFNVSGMYQEDTYALSYGRGLHDLLWPEKDLKVFLGFNVKSLSHKYKLDDRTRQTEATSSASPFRGGTAQSALSLDMGLLVQPLESFSLGLSGRNLNQPDVGLQQKDIVPRDYRLGFAWTSGDLAFFEDLTPSLEISYRKPSGNDADLRMHFGVESWFGFHTYALRLGGNDRELTFGGGWNKEFSRFGLQLDYAFVWSTLVEDNSGTHRITLSLRQGVAPSGDESMADVEEVPVEEAPPVHPPARTVKPEQTSPESLQKRPPRRYAPQIEDRPEKESAPAKPIQRTRPRR
ncbi:MAG TPA: type IX secretion system membrane protein PorP/SprF [Elusimicrobiota bacterium]|nr:type IX secretion system membrane protein PorP/SprF [Elusimicrobiota bacterium]